MDMEMKREGIALAGEFVIIHKDCASASLVSLVRGASIKQLCCRSFHSIMGKFTLPGYRVRLSNQVSSVSLPRILFQLEGGRKLKKFL